MTNKSKKRTRRSEPVEAPPPQRTRPNTPEPIPVDLELDEFHFLQVKNHATHSNQVLWDFFEKSPDDFMHIPAQLCTALFNAFIDNIIQSFNDKRILLQNAGLPVSNPLPPYSTSRCTTPVPPPPQVSKSKASAQTDKETLPVPPQRTYAEAASLTDPPATPVAPTTPLCSHSTCSHSFTPDPRSLSIPPTLSKPSTPAKPSTRSTPKTMGQRVVVHIGKSTHYSSRLGIPAVLPKLHKDISDALKKDESALQCLGVKLSRAKNLIITFPAKSSKSAIASAFTLLRTVLLLPQSVRLSFDTPWSYLSLANVPTRFSADALPFPVLELLEEVRNNPVLRDVAFTHLPSWVSDPSRLTKSRSSIAFAFEDPTGSIYRKIKQAEIFMFGTSVTVRDWSPRPPSAHPRPASGRMDTSE